MRGGECLQSGHDECRRSGAATTVNIFSLAVSIGKPSPSSMSMATAEPAERRYRQRTTES